MTWQISSTASAETEVLGKELGKLLEPPQVLELCSDLGGGKTTFVRGLAHGLGSKDNVTSPTFTLNNIYHSKHRPWKIHHFDFYRLDVAGIMSEELDESIKDNDSITIVEWGKVVEDILPAERIRIDFKPTSKSSDERQITFTYPENTADLIRQLQTNWTKLEP